MVKKIFLVAGFAAGLVLSGCAGVPIQEAQQNMGMVALKTTVDTKFDPLDTGEASSLFDFLPGEYYPTTGFFVRINEGQDPFTQEKVIVSNFTLQGVRGSDVCILNAEPGIYFAVAARVYQTKSDGTSVPIDIYFPKELVAMTKTTLRPGSVAYLGHHVLAEPKRSKLAEAIDDVQSHYFKVVTKQTYGAIYGTNYWKDKDLDLRKAAQSHALMNTGFGALLKIPHKTQAAEEKFLQRAIAAFKDSNWMPILQKRLEEIAKD